jgi:NAD(P)-dependent dehydrogenase (short-subunit alcohol dehydrogenase family)
MTRRWLVTGCSSGLGKALAAAAASAGDQVVATARRPAALEELDAARALIGHAAVTDQAAVV